VTWALERLRALRAGCIARPAEPRAPSRPAAHDPADPEPGPRVSPGEWGAWRARVVARAYPPQSKLARTPEAAAALATLDAALVAAIEAEDLPGVERALETWARWWHERVAAWRARPSAPPA
jgi:hypothetical protein